MKYIVKMCRMSDQKPVSKSFVVYADDEDEARCNAWDAYIEEKAFLQLIDEDDPAFVHVKPTADHQYDELYEFVLVDDQDNKIDVGETLMAWTDVEDYAREMAWDEIEDRLYADVTEMED